MNTMANGIAALDLMAPLVHSIAEYRDIQHNRRLLDYLRKRADAFEPDLIWERLACLHNAGLVVAKEFGLPYVLEWKDHLIPYRFSWYHGRAVAMENQKNREADYVVVESGVLGAISLRPKASTEIRFSSPTTPSIPSNSGEIRVASGRPSAVGHR